MTDLFYAVVKASLHANDASVFGLKPEEMSALAARFPGSSKEVVNGMLIKGNPLQVINSLGELGYRVVCSSGESDIVWTLKREALFEEDEYKYETETKTQLKPEVDAYVFSCHTDCFSGSPKTDWGTLQTRHSNKAIVESTTEEDTTSITEEEEESEKTYKLGARPEDIQEYLPDSPSRIYIRNPESFDIGCEMQTHVILRTNDASSNNPLAKRLIQGGGSSAAAAGQGLITHSAAQPVSQPGGAPAAMQRANPSVHQTIKEMDFERGLWFSAMMGDEEKVKHMLANGHSANEIDPSGYTALHYAAKNGYVNIVNILLKAGADVNLSTKAGHATALHRAAGAGKIEICRRLVAAGATCMARDIDGRTPLHRAVEGGHEAVTTLLITTNPEALRVVDVKGNTPLDVAKDDSMRALIARLVPLK